MVKRNSTVQCAQNICEFFEKRNKILEYPAGLWAKQKIIKQVRAGLCFFVEVVYNKIAVTMLRLCLLCTADGVAAGYGMLFGTLTGLPGADL